MNADSVPLTLRETHEHRPSHPTHTGPPSDGLHARSEPRPLQAVSLFSGVGGIDLALERCGIRTLLACEKDAAARRVLAARFPDTTIHEDVTELTADDLTRAGAVPGRTVLTAGWPCQGNSVAGRRGGMGDARSGLWVHVARLLAEFRPAWFVGENVPGLLSVNEGRDFARVLDDLAELGYGFAYRILDARYLGVPQRRSRVVIVGRLGDTAAAEPVEVLFEPEGVRGDSAPGGEAWPGVAGRARDGAAEGRGHERCCHRGHRDWPDGHAVAFDEIEANVPVGEGSRYADYSDYYACAVLVRAAGQRDNSSEART